MIGSSKSTTYETAAHPGFALGNQNGLPFVGKSYSLSCLPKIDVR